MACGGLTVVHLHWGFEVDSFRTTRAAEREARKGPLPISNCALFCQRSTLANEARRASAFRTRGGRSAAEVAELVRWCAERLSRLSRVQGEIIRTSWPARGRRVPAMNLGRTCHAIVQQALNARPNFSRKLCHRPILQSDHAALTLLALRTRRSHTLQYLAQLYYFGRPHR